MPSVIRMNGRIVAANRSFRNDQVCGEGKRVADQPRGDGAAPVDGTPIPPDSPDSPFRAGIPFYDEHDDVTYRVLERVNVAEGWGTSAFWIKRWGCYYGDVLMFVRMGWLDAALEVGSQTKRFRCRDESRVLARLAEMKAKRTTPVQAAPTPKQAPEKRTWKRLPRRPL